MWIEDDAIIILDYTKPELPDVVQEFRPTVYKDGDAYCCFLGPDPQAGIFGCGRSVEAAVMIGQCILLKD